MHFTQPFLVMWHNGLGGHELVLAALSCVVTTPPGISSIRTCFCPGKCYCLLIWGYFWVLGGFFFLPPFSTPFFHPVNPLTVGRKGKKDTEDSVLPGVKSLSNSKHNGVLLILSPPLQGILRHLRVDWKERPFNAVNRAQFEGRAEPLSCKT